MKSSFRVASVAGIDLRLHLSFALVPVLGATQWGGFGAEGALFGAVLSLFVFACVALHELGHALVARAFGVTVKDITLTPLGGVAQLGRLPRSPGEELLVALAGPLVNVALAALLWGGGVLLFGEESLLHALATLGRRAPTGLTLWVMLLTSNLGLAAFNLLPAFPMDGGRIFRAALSWFTPALTATTVAVWLGRALAVGLFALGLWAHAPTLPFIAAFVVFAGTAELQEARVSRQLGQVRAANALSPAAPRFAPQLSVGEALTSLQWSRWPAVAVEQLGRLLGVVTLAALVRAARAGELHRPVAELMDAHAPVLPSGASLAEVREAWPGQARPYLALVRDDGLLVGVLTEPELAQAFARLVRGGGGSAGSPRTA
jgi:Zn-dependent protease